MEGRWVEWVFVSESTRSKASSFVSLMMNPDWKLTSRRTREIQLKTKKEKVELYGQRGGDVFAVSLTESQSQ